MSITDSGQRTKKGVIKYKVAGWKGLHTKAQIAGLKKAHTNRKPGNFVVVNGKKKYARSAAAREAANNRARLCREYLRSTNTGYIRKFKKPYVYRPKKAKGGGALANILAEEVGIVPNMDQAMNLNPLSPALLSKAVKGKAKKKRAATDLLLTPLVPKKTRGRKKKTPTTTTSLLTLF